MNAWMLVAAFACLVASGSAYAQIRTSPSPGEQVRDPAPRLIHPTTRFDREAAVRALDKGTSMIKGTACARSRDGMFKAPNRMVLLLPMTSHLEEVLRLQKEARSWETVVTDENVLATSVQTMTDAKGRFQFTEMKPGRYYLFMVFDYAVAKSRDVYVGSSQGQYASANHYARQNYAVDRQNILEGVVQVEAEGQVVSTSLTNKGVMSKLLRCAPI